MTATRSEMCCEPTKFFPDPTPSHLYRHIIFTFMGWKGSQQRPRDAVVHRWVHTPNQRMYDVYADGFVVEHESEATVGNVALDIVQTQADRNGSIRDISRRVVPDAHYERREDTFIHDVPMHAMVQEARKSGRTQLYVIQAQKGMGKSKAVRRAVTSLPDSFSVLSLTFRRTLARGTAMDMGEGARTYLDFDSDVVFNAVDHPRLTVLVNSLCRVDPGDQRTLHSAYDILIVDELVSVLGMLGSSIIPDDLRYRIIERFVKIAQRASLVLVSDALMEEDALALVVSVLRGTGRRSLTTVVDYTHRNHVDWTFYSARTMSEWKKAIFARLEKGKRGVFPCMTKAFAKRLRDDVKRRFPELDVLLYVANSAEHDMEEHMSNVNEEWKRWDVVIWSPVITAGCSFEREHFDFCALQAFQGTCDVNSAVQMTSRVRNLRDKEVLVVTGNARDGFGGVVDAATEIFVRETWEHAFRREAFGNHTAPTTDIDENAEDDVEEEEEEEEDTRARDLVVDMFGGGSTWNNSKKCESEHNINLAVHDLVLASASRADETRKMRFESEFWKRTAWTGVRMCALTHPGTIQQYGYKGSTPTHVLAAVEKFCMLPKVYGNSEAVRQLLYRIQSSHYGDLDVFYVAATRGEAQADTSVHAISSTTEARLAKLEQSRLGVADEESKTRSNNEVADGVYFGSRWCPLTQQVIEIPKELRTSTTINLRNKYCPALGTENGDRAQVTLRHLEELGLLDPTHRTVRQTVLENVSGSPYPRIPTWVNQENGSLWQIAVHQIVAKTLFEWDRRRGWSGMPPRVVPPPKTFTQLGSCASITDLKSKLPKRLAIYHEHMSDMLYQLCPIPSTTTLVLWSRLKDIEEDADEVVDLAWAVAAEHLGMEGVDRLTESRRTDVAKFCHAAATLMESSMLAGYERVFITPFIGQEALDTKVTVGYVGIDRDGGVSVISPCFTWRRASLSTLYRCLAPIVVGAASFQHLYKHNVQFTHAISVTDGCMVTLPFTKSSALRAPRILDAVLNKVFMDTPSLSGIFFIPSSLSAGTWDVWWPERGVAEDGMDSSLFISFLLSAQAASPRVRKVTWNAIYPLCQAMAKQSVPPRDAQRILGATEDVAWHAAFVSGLYMTKLAGICEKRIILGGLKEHEVTLEDILNAMLQAGRYFDLSRSRPMRLQPYLFATRVVQHAAGVDPFPETIDMPTIPEEHTPGMCGKLASLYVGSIQSGNMIATVDNGDNDMTVVVNTDPLFQLAWIIGWHGTLGIFDLVGMLKQRDAGPV